MAADGARMEDFSARGQEVDTLLKKGSLSEAVMLAVNNPPLNSKDAAIKVRCGRVGFNQFRISRHTLSAD